VYKETDYRNVLTLLIDQSINEMMQHKQYYERVDSRSASSLGPDSDNDNDNDDDYDEEEDPECSSHSLLPPKMHPLPLKTIECECLDEDSMLASLSNENLMLHDRVNELERELGVFESRIAQQRVLINQLQSLVWSMENTAEPTCAPHDTGDEDASVLAAVENGETSLMVALLSSSPSGQSAKMILGRVGTNALQIACQKGHLEIVTWLIETGHVDVRADFDSALQWAAKRGDQELAGILLRNGADPTSLNGCAIRIALDRGHNEIAKQLMEHVSYPSNKTHSDIMTE
jgi:hypothetical protein